MPFVEVAPQNPFSDGRQSERALAVQRTITRMLLETGHAVLPEFPLANGRRADLIAIDRKGQFTIIEIKSSVADFRIDSKWPQYADFCDRFAFAAWHEVPTDIFPQDEGLIMADGYDAAIIREAAGEALHAARRKALTLRFARFAAQRAERLVQHAMIHGLTADLGDHFEPDI